MRFLLDTNVVSALRTPSRNPRVARWATTIPVADLFVASLTITEIERGVAAKERSDSTQGAILRCWFEQQVLTAFAGRILPFDLAAARVLGGYRVPEHAPLDDALIAAIAEANGLVMVTRDVKHIDPLGVEYLNPWEA